MVEEKEEYFSDRKEGRDRQKRRRRQIEKKAETNIKEGRDR